METEQAAEQRQTALFKRPSSVAPAGAFYNSDSEPTAHAVGYPLTLLRSFRRGRKCKKPR